MGKYAEKEIYAALKHIQDPELQIGVVDLGFIYNVTIDEKNDVRVDMTLTAPGCPYGDAIMLKVRTELEKLEGIGRVSVNLVYDPPWDPKEMASDYAKDELGIW